MYKYFLVLLFFFFSLSATEWQRVGPTGSAFKFLKIAPKSKGDIIYAWRDISQGICKTENSGVNWNINKINENLLIKDLSIIGILPEDSRVMIGNNVKGEFFRTENSGEHWRAICAPLTSFGSVTGVSAKTDFGKICALIMEMDMQTFLFDYYLGTSLDTGKTWKKELITSDTDSLMNSPYMVHIGDDDVIYYAYISVDKKTSTIIGTKLFRTSNATAGFEDITSSLPASDNLLVNFSPQKSNSDNIALVIEGEAYLSETGGSNWDKLESFHMVIDQMHIHPENKNLIEVHTDSLLLLSNDFGKTWNSVFLEDDKGIKSVVFVPDDDKHLYLITEKSILKGNIETKKWSSITENLYYVEYLFAQSEGNYVFTYNSGKELIKTDVVNNTFTKMNKSAINGLYKIIFHGDSAYTLVDDYGGS